MLLNYSQIVFSYAIIYLTPYIRELILVFLSIFNIRYYMISGEKEMIRKILKNLETDTYAISRKHVNGKDNPSGYIFGNRCIGYIDNRSNFDLDDKIHILTTVNYYKHLIKEKQIVYLNASAEPEPVEAEAKEGQGEQRETAALLPNDTPLNKEEQSILVYVRSGQYTNMYYRGHLLDVSHINPIGEQKEVLNSILQIYRKKGRATIFLHGVSFAGKTSVGYLVAKELKGSFCHTFNPSDPGDSFYSMINDIRSNDNNRDHDDKPIVITLEEVNVLIRNIHTKSILQNAKIPTYVRDKTTWATMLDDMVFYPNVIFIMTSNESKEEIDALDPAYLRKGRVDATFAMLKELPINI